MNVFVPINDEMLENMDGSELPVPYQAGLPLQPIIIDQCDQLPAITDLADKLPGDPQRLNQVPRQGRH